MCVLWDAPRVCICPNGAGSIKANGTSFRRFNCTKLTANKRLLAAAISG